MLRKDKQSDSGSGEGESSSSGSSSSSSESDAKQKEDESPEPILETQPNFDDILNQRGAAPSNMESQFINQNFEEEDED